MDWKKVFRKPVLALSLTGKTLVYQQDLIDQGKKQTFNLTNAA